MPQMIGGRLPIRLGACLALLGLLLAGCGKSGLRYRLTPGLQARYRYAEVIAIQAGAAASLPQRIELRYHITAAVTGTDGDVALLQVAVDSVTVELTDREGTRPLPPPPDQAATLRLRRDTGDVLAVQGAIALPVVPGMTLNPLDAFRQSLPHYPEQAPRPGSRWPARVHGELARNLSAAFAATATYEGDATVDGVPVARLAVEGTGPLRDGPGRLRVRSFALVDRRTGLPEREEGVSWLESPDLTVESRGTLVRLRD